MSIHSHTSRIAVAALLLALAAPAAADHHEADHEKAAERHEADRGTAADHGGAAAHEASDAMERDAGMPPATTGEVPRAQFTSAVVDREPTDALDTLPTGSERVFFFTELRGFQGQEVVHRWEHAGEVKAEVPFEVAGPRWRVYSIKTLDPSWTGDWTVSVLDANGDVVASETLEVVEASTPASAEPSMESPEEETSPASPMP